MPSCGWRNKSRTYFSMRAALGVADPVVEQTKLYIMSLKSMYPGNASSQECMFLVFPSQTIGSALRWMGALWENWSGKSSSFKL